MLPPKLWNILGCLAFSEKKFRPKLDPTPVKSLLENAMGNPFFDFFRYWPKLFKKIFRIKIWAFYFQICFRNQFSTLGSGQPENTLVFSIWPLPEVQKWFQKQIWNQNVHFSVLNFFLKRFGQYLKKSKNEFPIVFWKSDLTGIGSIFWRIFFWKSQTPQNMPKFGW